jgi:tRNA (adenine37-N6)-methyltransferase
MLYLEVVASTCCGEQGGGMSIELRAIGFVRTDAEELPRHWSASDVEGTLVIDEEYCEGLRDIEPGQRIVVIFNFHRSPGFSPEFLRQTSGHRGRKTGVFSTCSPIRPNPLGMSVVEVLGIRDANIDVRRLDMLDGTPILDVKPHIEDRRG